jgi:uncharacterized protein YndB with AHSA1/START domain
VPDGIREYVTYIDAQYDDVWEAITNCERHADWNVAPCLAFGHRTGARCAWGEPAKPVIEGKVTAWRPAKGSFSHTFRFAFYDEPESTVEWEVEEQGEVVSVTVRHDLGPKRERPKTRSIVEGSWFLVLARLKTLLETGGPMPWPTGPA